MAGIRRQLTLGFEFIVQGNKSPRNGVYPSMLLCFQWMRQSGSKYCLTVISTLLHLTEPIQRIWMA
jgi:hypothetical protein